MSRDDIIERIAGQWARTELTDEGQSLTLGAQVGETSELVGDVVLFWRSRAHAGGELGYVFNPALGGRGYATEAANVMLRLGFEGLGLHRIVARIDERNESSVKLARRLGMRQEARRSATSSSKASGAPSLTSRCSLTSGTRAGRNSDFDPNPGSPGPSRTPSGTCPWEGMPSALR